MAMRCFLLFCLPIALHTVQADPRQFSNNTPPFVRHTQTTSAPLPESRSTIIVHGSYRFITGNGIPDHEPGTFPNRRNPNAISAQTYRYRVPLHPVQNNTTRHIDMNPFGVAINGVPFDPNANEFWQNNRRSGWQYEALSGFIDLGMDAHNAHVQPNGAYHYHGIADVWLQSTHSHSPLVGYAADGFPIYARVGYRNPNDPQQGTTIVRSSYRVKSGTRPTSRPNGAYDGRFVQDFTFVDGSGDLDACNGRFGITPEYPNGTYHYFLTDAFPFVPRCWAGTPDNSFLRRPQDGNRQNNRPNNRHRPPTRF